MFRNQHNKVNSSQSFDIKKYSYETDQITVAGKILWGMDCPLCDFKY